MKTCSKCKIEKSELDFHKLHKAKDGLQHRCKACMAAINHAIYMARSPEARKALNKGYRNAEVSARSDAKRRAKRVEDPEWWARQIEKHNATRRAKRRMDSAYREKASVNKKSSTHKISVEEVLLRQTQPCGICGQLKGPGPLNGGRHLRTRMNIDHDHKTGKIRGTLCDHCNRGIGLFGDSVSRLEAAVSYLKLW